MAGLGVSVVLATVGPRLSREQRRELPEDEGLLELFESGFSPEWAPGFRRDQQRSEEWLLQLASHVAPDLVHLNGLLHSGLPWDRPTLVAGDRCLASRWQDLKGKQLPKQWDFYRHHASLGLRSAGLVVAGTRTGLNRLHEHYGPFAAERVIPLGWSAPKRSGTKRGFIISAQRLWDEATNVQGLEVCAPFLSWPIFCAGEALDEAGARMKLRARNVCCLGALPEAELEQWLLESSIYVMPARSADCQLSVIQAAAAGCALVLGNHPGLKEIWDDAAVFVPPEDPEALRFALDRMIRDEGRRRDLAERARQRAEEFSLPVMIGEYGIAYHELVVSGTRRSGTLSNAVGV